MKPCFSRAAGPKLESSKTGRSMDLFTFMDVAFVAWCIGLALSPVLLLVLYIYWNDSHLTRIPPSVQYFSPKRHTVEDVHAEAERLAAAPPIEDTEKIPPKTGRRYIVVGGVSVVYTHKTKAKKPTSFLRLGRFFGRMDCH